MNKVAFLTAYLNKTSGTRYTDMPLGAASNLTLNGLTRAVTGEPLAGDAVAGLANLAGTVTGLSSSMTLDDVKKLNKAPALIPGVGSYRAMAIPKAVGRDYEKRTGKTSKFVPEIVGPLTSTLAATGLGAGAGGLLGAITGGGSKDIAEATIAGGATGLSAAALANLITAITAGSTHTRSQKEQDESEQGSRAAQYLVPGKSTYDYLKRLGYGYSKQEPSIPKKAELDNPLTDKIKAVWSGLSADQKMAIIGGLAGGAAGGTYGAITGGPERKNKINKALGMGLLGAGVGAGAGYLGNKAVNAINPGTGASTPSQEDTIKAFHDTTRDRAFAALKAAGAFNPLPRPVSNLKITTSPIQ